MKRLFFISLALGGLVCLGGSSADAQPLVLHGPNDPLPSEWDNMTPAEFVESELSDLSALSPLRTEQARIQSVIFLRDTNAAADAPLLAVLQMLDFAKYWLTDEQRADVYGELEKRAAEAATAVQDRATIQGQRLGVLSDLLRVAGKELAPELRNAAIDQLRGRPLDIASLPFTEIVALVELELSSDAANHQSQTASKLADWVLSHDIDTAALSDLRSIEWLMNRLTRSSALHNGDLDHFTVTWTGTITAPQSGEYTFSVGATNIQETFTDWHGRHNAHEASLSVDVGGQRIINATPESWNYKSEAVALKAKQPVPITVSYRYQTSIGEVSSEHPAEAMLFWEGPGIVKTVVPASAFPEGLQATYRYQLGDETSNEVVTEPNVEHCWFMGWNFINPHAKALQKVVEEFWGRVTDPDYMGACAAMPIAGRPRKVHRLMEFPGLSSFLSCEQRVEFLELLVARPEWVKQLTWQEMYAAYLSLRQGAEDRALEFMASWMQLQDDVSPQLVTDSEAYFMENLQNYRQLALFFRNRPEQLGALADQYLETSEGECCLPLAYMLAYAHVIRNERAEWIELLDAKLADEAVTGDRRVSWLIARAFAEELRTPSSRVRMPVLPRLLLGRGWLDEAMLVADTESARLQALQEIVARQVALGQDEQVTRRVEQETGNFTDAQSQLAFSGWQASLQQFAQQRIDQREEAARASQDAYVAELRRRQQRATDRNDTAGQERYSTLIRAAEEQTTAE